MKEPSEKIIFDGSFMVLDGWCTAQRETGITDFADYGCFADMRRRVRRPRAVRIREAASQSQEAGVV